MLGDASRTPARLSVILIGRTIHDQDESTIGCTVMCWNLPQDGKT
jgi:hypothetical protein